MKFHWNQIGIVFKAQQVTWLGSSPSVAARGGVPIGFVEVTDTSYLKLIEFYATSFDAGRVLCHLF